MVLLFLLKFNNNNNINICNSIRLKYKIRMSSSQITFYYNDVYKQPLPIGHRFPMEKYRIVRESLRSRLRCIFIIRNIKCVPI
jgi:hypothetical protein